MDASAEWFERLRLVVFSAVVPISIQTRAKIHTIPARQKDASAE
jgi:hypothetical protein